MPDMPQRRFHHTDMTRWKHTFTLRMKFSWFQRRWQVIACVIDASVLVGKSQRQQRTDRRTAHSEDALLYVAFKSFSNCLPSARVNLPTPSSSLEDSP